MLRIRDNIREAKWGVIGLAIVAYCGTSASLNFLAGPVGQTDIWAAVDAIERATGSWVQAPLLFSTFHFAILGAIFLGAGRLRFSDLSWRAGALLPAVWVMLGFWIAMQAGLGLWVLLQNTPLRWNLGWTDPGPANLLGQLLAQVLGNALVEETLFRGFLVPQLYLKALAARCRPAAAMSIALVGSQVLFALTHIPHRMFILNWPVAELPGDQFKLILYGLTYAGVYLVTGNLFLAVGVHALWNQPARLWSVPFSPGVQVVWFGAVLGLALIWPVAERSRRRKHRTDEPSKHREA